MILIYHPIGAVSFFIPLAATAIATVYMPQGTEWMLLSICGAVTLVWDLAYRIIQSGGHWWVPTMGGHLYYIPVWLLGLVELLLYVHIASQKGKWLPF